MELCLKTPPGKIRGYRVELEAVERIINSLDSIEESITAAYDRPNTKEKYITAIDPPPNQTELRKELRDILPEYMIPSVFVMLEQFPLTHRGKINRDSLPEPNRLRPLLGQVYQAPQTDTERTLVLMWEEILEIIGIGIHDDFFDLGGDSLQAMELHKLVEIELVTQVPIQTLFQAPTIARVASCIKTFKLQKGQVVSKEKTLVPLRVTGSKPILFLIHGMNGHVFASPYFLKILGENQPVYAFHVTGLNRS